MYIYLPPGFHTSSSSCLKPFVLPRLPTWNKSHHHPKHNIKMSEQPGKYSTIAPRELPRVREGPCQASSLGKLHDVAQLPPLFRV